MFAYYSSTIFLAVFSSVIMELFVCKNNMFPKVIKQLFLLLYLIIGICSLTEWTGVFLQKLDYNTRILHIIAKTIDLSFAPLIGVLSALIISRFKPLKIIILILVLNVILECTSALFGFIFYIDANNVYHRMQFYWIYIFTYSIGAAYFVVSAILSMKNYQYNGNFFPFIIMIFSFSSLVEQTFWSWLKLSWITMAMTGMMIYIFYSDMIQNTDALTSLVNRRGYENRLNSLQKESFIIEMDVDNFKKVNDTYGHHYGDFCLNVIGNCIRKIYASYGKCYRIGGDEFCVITDKKVKDIEALNSSFFAMLEKERAVDSRIPKVSLGFVHFNPENSSVEGSIKEVDRMMYIYKHRNKE